ncbi:MAG: peptidase [Gammaproteobacteria bacterium HGW-Gammaproteobacteria-4]|nr:MAG: peptidase [Gammaproteobacteria bacterium HGW-Gammaproteobacteria-4]
MTQSTAIRTVLAASILLALAACSKTPESTATADAPAKPPLVLDLKTPLSQFTVAELDPNTPVCTDLNGFANNTWLAANPVPSDRTSWGSFELLAERSLEIQRAIVEHAAANAPEAGSIEAKIGDLWATGMDEAAINAAGIAPIQPLLDPIDAITDSANLADYLRKSYADGNGMLFGFGPQADFKNSDMNMAYATQGGLGLPDRGYYLEDRADYIKAREAYVLHIANMLTLAGAGPEAAQAQAADIMAFETRLAKVSLSSEEMSRDVSKFYNPVTVADADKLTPNFPWSRFFESQGVAQPELFSLAQPEFHAELSAMMGDTAIDIWKSYLRFHTVDEAAPFLADAFAQENFNFYNKTLRGQQEMQPRWKRVLNTINRNMGEALGQAYVDVTFSPEAKAQAQHLVHNLSEALKARIENLAWMSDETKAKAIEKWASFTPKIGYPDKWRDWSGLNTDRSSYIANLLAASRFNYRFELDKIGKPVDKTEWGMSPQTVNAYYNPLANEIVFPAAILQPPFFDPNADEALNYGGIGAVIGHEMTHGYDDQGSRFDAKGNFSNWWTDADSKGFGERTGKLVDQFNQYVSVDDIHVNGRLTLGENIADLGGLSVAYDALQKALADNPEANREIDGYNQTQRFFLNWAVVWRRNFKPEELKVRLTTDPHAPANFRAIGAPSNIPAFAEAFACTASDPMVRDGDSRVVIW